MPENIRSHNPSVNDPSDVWAGLSLTPRPDGIRVWFACCGFEPRSFQLSQIWLPGILRNVTVFHERAPGSDASCDTDRASFGITVTKAVIFLSWRLAWVPVHRPGKTAG